MGSLNSYTQARRVQTGQAPGLYRLLLSGPPVMNAITPNAQGVLLALTGPVTANGFGSVQLGRLTKAVLAGSGSGKNILPSLSKLGRWATIHSVRSNLTFVKQDNNLIAAFQLTYSLGTTATADATLSGTEVNLLPETGTLTASAGTLVAAEQPLVAYTPANLIISTSDAIFLNVKVLDASITDSTTANVRVFGYIDLALTLN